MSRLPKRMLSCILAAVACFGAGLSLIYLSDAYQQALRRGAELTVASLRQILGGDVSLVRICSAAALVCVVLIAALYISEKKDLRRKFNILICAISGAAAMLTFFFCMSIVLSVEDMAAGLPLSAVLLDRSCLVPGLLMLVALYFIVRLIGKRNAAA